MFIMYVTTQTIVPQPHTLFGGYYVLEQHCDETERNLPPAEKHEFVVHPDLVMKTFRAALSELPVALFFASAKRIREDHHGLRIGAVLPDA
jgi:hypothetical protein